MPTTDAAELTARAIIDANLYLVLATADGTGQPWSSPVYFAHDGYAEFFWVSAPEAEHSRNIAARPRVGIVIFDSHAPIGTGQGVYIRADAEQAWRTSAQAADIPGHPAHSQHRPPQIGSRSLPH
jgi:general stress protein 26